MRFGGLVAAIAFAAIAAFIVLRMAGKDEQQAPVVVTAAAPSVKTVNVYVASQPISIGSRVTQEMIGVQPWPENLLIEGFIRTEGGPNVVGMLARAPFAAQEPLMLSKLANPNDPNFLAGSLPKGMRVITLQTNEVESSGGFIFPGDRVDVMLTHQVTAAPGSDPASTPVAEPVTETILTNATILAVDQRATGAGTTDKNGNLIIPRTVSLMVSPSDAQRLKLASQRGTITFVLRSLEDKETSDPLSTTHLSDVSNAGIASIDRDTVMVVRGVSGEEVDTPAPANQATQSTPITQTIVRGNAATPVAPVKAEVTPPTLPPTSPTLPPPPSPMK
jgi:pilus assembly protein CpaB